MTRSFVLRATPFLAVMLMLPSLRSLRAQDTTSVAADTTIPAPAAAKPQPAESVVVKPPVSPMGALWRSILIPGWGQAKLNRKLTGAIFVVWEGVTLGMAIKTNHELDYLRHTGSGSVSAKESEREDWLVLLGFNHLFSAVEAYVSAHLWDFPSDLEIRAAPIPGGGVGASLRVPFRVP
jgi:hypothetical protein